MSENKKGILDKIPFLQKLKNVKHIEIIVICIFVVVLAVIYMSSNSNSSNNNYEVKTTSLEEYGEYLEGKLKKVLSNINGAQNVEVMITFNGRITYEYATEKEETTTSSSVTGGTNSKTTTNEEILIISQNGKETPIIVKEIYPPIAGVVVVSGGAKDVGVKLNIISAIQTALDVNENCITVLVGES